MRILICSMFFVLSISLLAGCESNNNVSIKKNESLTNSQTIIQAIQKNDFTDAEIESIIDACVNAMDKKHPKKHISTKKLDKKNDTPSPLY